MKIEIERWSDAKKNRGERKTEPTSDVSGLLWNQNRFRKREASGGKTSRLEIWFLPYITSDFFRFVRLRNFKSVESASNENPIWAR